MIFPAEESEGAGSLSCFTTLRQSPSRITCCKSKLYANSTAQRAASAFDIRNMLDYKFLPGYNAARMVSCHNSNASSCCAVSDRGVVVDFDYPISWWTPSLFWFWRSGTIELMARFPVLYKIALNKLYRFHCVVAFLLMYNLVPIAPFTPARSDKEIKFIPWNLLLNL